MSAKDDPIYILPANDSEREWGARLLSGSEPWLTLQVSLQTCRENCFDTSYNVFIAHVNDKPAGIIIIHTKGIAGSPYIKSIAVDTSFQKNGVGSALMHFAEVFSSKISRHLFLCVSSFNMEAQTFYLQLGYSKVGEFPDYIIKSASELLLYKCLQ